MHEMSGRGHITGRVSTSMTDDTGDPVTEVTSYMIIF